LFTEPDFGGKNMTVRGEAPRLAIKMRSMKLRTPPRIDFVTVSKYAPDGSQCSFRLHLSGANIDDGAAIVLDDNQRCDSAIEIRLDNASWLGIGTDVAQAGYNLDPTYFGFPVFHYDLIGTNLQERKFGQTIKIKVQNPDGQFSNELAYVIPSPDLLDSDGDGLLDSWEIDGVDGLDLKSLGANPHRKDLYVEVDRMVVPGRIWSDFAEKEYPRPDIFADIEELFRQAPVLNTDGSTGITVHIDYGQPSFEGTGTSSGGTEIPWQRYIGFKDLKDTNVAEGQESQYCNATLIRDSKQYFDPSRRKVFRYCIFADQQWDSRSTGAGNKSSIFFLTLGVCRMKAIDRNYQIGVFVHEFGHLFGLTHTGDQGTPYNNKPNFNSLMNYLYTFSGQDIDGKIGGVDGEVSGDQVYLYSDGMRATINEASLNEVLGVANHYPHDWNGNQQIDSQPVQVFLRNPRYTIPRPLTDCCEWALMNFGIRD
ncbi:MAG: hypothetical protein KDB00_06635, partial [Planctomycetales bacterium]|nr:hypothetical protein [Planctomycetales bacterium]